MQPSDSAPLHGAETEGGAANPLTSATTGSYPTLGPMGSSTGPGTQQVCCQEELTRGCKAVSGNHGWRPQTPGSTALAWEASN